MNFQLVIVNSSNKFFSGIKDHSPKMFNKMKSLTEQYNVLFKEHYKVKRIIRTQKGYKFI